MLKISNNVSIPDNEVEISATRSAGPGGQNVNKVSTAVHVRFDIPNSSLPDFYKNRLTQLNDQRITGNGILIIKSRQHRSFEDNKSAALDRLLKIIKESAQTQKKRKSTKATKGSQKRRMDKKTRHGKTKNLRKKVDKDHS